MDKQRIDEFIRILNDMTHGNFHPALNIPKSDPMAPLVDAILAVGESFEKQCQEQRKLASITEKINDGLLLTDILKHIFETFQDVIPYDRISVALIDEDKQELRACCARSNAATIIINEGYSAPIKGSSLEKIIQTGEPRIINDLEHYLAQHPHSESTRLIVKEGMRSSLTCPLIAINKPVGFIFFSCTQKNRYRNIHLDTFQKIARQLSVIFEKSRMYEQLVQLNDLKNKFFGIAAHDLRSPIGVIKNFIILFLNGYLGEIDDKQREVLDTMDRNCDRMLNLINNLLDFSAIESGRLELNLRPIDPHEFFHTYQSMAKSLADKKRIKLKLNIEPYLPEITVDANRFMQVLDNLVTNAIKFSHPDTTVTIGAHRTDDGIKISVADQGQGIPENEISKIFKEFSKTSVKPTAGEKSTGLGLAIVKRIIEAHNGTIEVSSIVGKGTTFMIKLPVDKSFK